MQYETEKRIINEQVSRKQVSKTVMKSLLEKKKGSQNRSMVPNSATGNNLIIIGKPKRSIKLITRPLRPEASTNAKPMIV